MSTRKKLCLSRLYPCGQTRREFVWEMGAGFSGLALNRKGVERALDAEVDEVRYVVVASETFNQKNQGASIAETVSYTHLTLPTILHV